MDMVQLEHKTINEVGYDAAAKTMRILTSGVLWEYSNVPKTFYDALVESPGSIAKLRRTMKFTGRVVE